ncbi:MAG: hypothetical protein E7167_05150 [Firmicutes bacterium]|nr:hypothetical protein [Bacillota bacterium]
MMQKKTKNSKYTPAKNYIYGLIIFLAVILLAWYFISWYKVKQTEKLMTSYLVTSNTVNYEIKDITEIVQVLKESPSEYFVYISYNNDEDVYKLEKKLKKAIDNYGLKDEFYYINITDYQDDENIYTKLNDTFNTTRIKNSPCILYFKNNELESVILNNNQVFDINEFTELLEEYEYEKLSQ